ncbi:MAG TPA: polysaccharide biosynthesis/export family protein [Pyrinomonadaceae bacterium]|jgi:protein involved in polysaccharide export with SLBB domain|nr:polysaccharide biosynthesis/export family protein [Pyrinomonadaceae bacterium]
MKKVLSATAIALAVCAFEIAAAGTQAGNARVGPFAEEKSTPGGSASPAVKKEEKKSAPAAEDKNRKNDPKTGRQEDKKSETDSAKTPAAVSSTAANAIPPVDTGLPSATSDAPSKSGGAPVVPLASPVKSAPEENGGETKPNANRESPAPSKNPTPGTTSNSTAASAATPAVSLTSLYRIGTGDVLDIRLLNQSDPRQSTLYTVMAGGVLEYPLLSDPLTVSGMTVEELAGQLIAELKHRAIYDKPQVRVSVRDYASHAVLVSGLVSDPGTKILRREAIPLYVVVAEAQAKPEAGRAVVVSHSTGQTTSVDLTDAAGMNLLVQPGDVVNVVARQREFFYIGGEIGAPGQKDFHPGMTLTQAVLASGGATRPEASRIKVSRQGADGRLVFTEYNLSEIEEGRIPDPGLQPGDRIEVGRRRK